MNEPKVATLIVAAALLVPAPRALAAQVVSKLEAGQYTVTEEGGALPLTMFRFAPTVQWQLPYGQVSAHGSAYLSDQQVQLADGIVSGTFTSPTVYGVRAEMIGNASRAVDDRSLGTDQVDVQTRVHLELNQHGGVWFGGGVARPWRVAVISSADVADAGAWGKLGEARSKFGTATMTATFTNFSFSKIAALGDSGVVAGGASASASACDVAPTGTAASSSLRALFDESAAGGPCERQSRFADLEGSLRWEVGPLELFAQTGHRFGDAYDVTPDSRQWTSASATVWLSDRIAIIGGGGRQPALPLRGLPARSYGMAGLELAYAPMTKSAVPVSLPHTVLVRSFDMHVATNGMQKIVIRVGGVETVDIMGDFSDWAPLTLVRRGRDLWELSVPVAAGVHQIDVRVDNGPWMAPPGIPSVHSAYDGEVGLLVVSGR